MYKTINGWTKDDMIAHVLSTYKGRSIKGQGGCAYRGPRGKKCAVGMFIPDELYEISMEGTIPTNPAFGHIKFPLCMEGMEWMQTSHDNPHVDESYCQDDENTLASIICWIEENVKDTP